MRIRRVLPAEGHAQLVKRASKWLSGMGHRVILPEFSTWSTSHEVPDVIGWRVRHRGAHSTLVEVKVSRADFLADRKKPHRADSVLGMGRYRYYFCPPGLVRVEELPARWGLAEVSGRSVAIVHQATAFPEYARQHEIALLVQAIRRERDPSWGSKLYVETPCEPGE